MNNLAIKLLFFTFCFIFGTANAQFKSLQFDRLTTDDGLSQSTVTCIYQDYQGFLWFGTYDGLNKYDGYKFTVYYNNPDDSTSISNNFIWAIYEDSDKNLWIGTRDGLNLYERNLDAFKQFKSDNNSQSLSSNFIRSITGDGKGNLWIGTNNSGLNYYNHSTGKFNKFFHEANKPGTISDNNINVLFHDSRSNLWIGTRDGNLNLRQPGKNYFEHIWFKNGSFINSTITSITEDQNNGIWIGTQGQGLFRIKYISEGQSEILHFTSFPKQLNALSSNIILSLFSDRSGRIWIGTDDEGLNCYLPDMGTFRRYPPDKSDNKNLSHRSIWSLYEDKTGNIWIGTFAGGINLVRRYNTFFKLFKYFPGNPKSLISNQVTAFFEEPDKRLWIATGGSGLNLFDYQNESYINYNMKNSGIGGNAVLSLYEDSKQRFWVGTWMGGLNLLDRRTGKFTIYTVQNHNLGSNNIFGIIEDKNGGLWLSTFLGGITYFNPENGQTKIYNSDNSSISDNNVNRVIRDYLGNLWVCAETGLNYFDVKSEKFTVYKYSKSDTNSISKGNLLSIYLASDTTLWIGTNGGLNRFNPRTKSFIKYYIEDGLPSNSIKGIIEGNDSNIWLTTNNGISCLNPASNTFKNYDISDGLQGNEFYWHSIYKSPDGQIYAGGINGFNSFYPDSIGDNPFVPPIVITEFRIFNKPMQVNTPDSPLKKNISLTKEMTLTYKQSVISFEFTSLNYISPMKNQYAYILEGFEDNWNYVGSKRTATYTNLDAGEYIFRVKGSNNDGVWNEIGASIKIIVEPPFWKTWWAYTLYVLFVASIIIIIVRQLIIREQLKNALKLEHLELEKMNEIDQLKSRFFTNVSHEFRTPITLIMSPLEPIISDEEVHPRIKKKLQVIYRNANRLLRMTNELMDFHKIEAGEYLLELSHRDIIQFVHETAALFNDYARAHKIQFSMQSETENYEAWFDSDKLDKIIYNLLSNAFKFTKSGGRINVHTSIIDSEKPFNVLSNKDYDRAEKYIQIKVHDNGLGIPANKLDHIFNRFYQAEINIKHEYPGSGVGLALVYEFINLYHGKINVDSKENEGSVFTIEIPLDIDFLEKHQLVRKYFRNPIEHPDLFEEKFTEMSVLLSEPFPNTALEDCKEDTITLPSILIIDDDPELISFIKEDFQTRFRVYEALEGKAGYQKAIELIPDIIISDIVMPELEGTELCRMLKKDERTSHIPIILLTAKSSDEYRIKGFEIGADSYITKPFNLSVLRVQVSNLLEIRKKLKEKFSINYFIDDSKLTSGNPDELFLSKAAEIIKKHLHNPDFNADVLSKEIGMSRMQLYRKFRALTDQTVHEFIKRIRLQVAAQLLLKKRVTVTEVAFDVGFKDLTYFARCFRQQFGVSPSQYITKRK